MDAAEKIVGNATPATGSEDFADMLKHVKGAYCRIGHSGTEPLHSPKFVFDTNIIPIGASILATLVENQLPNN
jgi:metal-dependent amidase/aminoacylase/carboxypeptidase family protein